MDLERYFIATAQISLAIAGFAGIVAAYRNHLLSGWGEVERLWLRLLLLNSILPFTFSLLGIFVLATEIFPVAKWQMLSGFASLCLAPYIFTIVRRILAFPPGALRAAGSSIFASLGLVSILIAIWLLQVWNAALGSAFWPFFGAILALVVGAVFQFVRLVLKPLSSNAERPYKTSDEDN